jgi:DNA helicase II / ATP-dependent DNA helicase PcrA
MKLTDQQRQVVLDRNDRVVSSCPGSGKTRTIIAKIQECIEEVRESARKIGCITYTNAATNEIVTRLLETGATGDEDYYEVNTIHSFCLTNIVRPYSYLVDEIKGGFSIVAPDSEWYEKTVSELAGKYSVPIWAKEQFANISKTAAGETILPKDIPEAAAAEFLERLRAEKLVTFSGIVYFAFLIVTNHKFVARAVSSRFAWLLVDEFQDTSELQTAILCVIHEVGHTKLFLVGDENQSIYAFAGARPELMAEIATIIKAKTDIPLSGNFRCSEKIIAVAERLCPGKPAMVALGETKDHSVAPIYKHANSAKEAILGYFLPLIEKLSIPYGKTAILAAWWTSLFPLARALRERGIPVIGPGARPYRRSLDFAQFAEATAAYLVCSDIESAVGTQRALFFMLLSINREADWRIFSYDGKRVLCRMLNRAEELAGKGMGAVNWLQSFAKEATSILMQEELLSFEGAQAILVSTNGMVASIKQVVSDPANMAIEELGIFARPDQCIQLMTMHGSKGREFDAVAVIDFHEGKVPHFSVKDAPEIAEARRLTYVTATRARKLLVFFSDASHPKNKPSRFVDEMGLS